MLSDGIWISLERKSCPFLPPAAELRSRGSLAGRILLRRPRLCLGSAAACRDRSAPPFPEHRAALRAMCRSLVAWLVMKITLRFDLSSNQLTFVVELSDLRATRLKSVHKRGAAVPSAGISQRNRSKLWQKRTRL